MSTEIFQSPIDDRYFEDYQIGATYVFGELAVSEDEIVEFARRYDPQDFHTDAAAASAGPFGGLIASGWMTAGLMMRLYADHYLSKNASLASPGVDELRWIKPVRPGDRLSIRVTVVEARRSRSKPDRGLVRSAIEVINQAREPVMTMTAMNLLGCRDK
ncbi:MAG TPA: MaoC family dehydratase [Rhodocyclaceae bacterium]|nr:MaoC family dehydratase [Rhodocyclaceae bacterium]